MWIDDTVLSSCGKALTLAVWTPSSRVVVLGASNLSSLECYEAACAADQVPILKRYGGGGAVVLHEGCVVLSLGTWVEDPFKNAFYFERLNAALCAALAASWPVFSSLSQKGISDLCLGDKKIAGTSLFRSRNYLLYQASLLVDAKAELLGRYLRHPSKEPDYRQKKPHKDFLGSLKDAVPELSCEGLEAVLKARFLPVLKELLGCELTEPVPEQIEHLLKKAKVSPHI